MSLFEFEARLIYTVNSRTARALKMMMMVVVVMMMVVMAVRDKEGPAEGIAVFLHRHGQKPCENE